VRFSSYDHLEFPDISCTADLEQQINMLYGLAMLDDTGYSFSEVLEKILAC